jgi:regulator of sigma E protease
LSDIALTIPALVVLLGTLVFFHEFGHFAIAKLLGIRVEEFAFGFGPKWIRLFKRGDTEYTIHPVPLGGFVKLAGMEPGQEDVPGGFNSHPWWRRFLVYAAGPLMSFVLAYLIFCTLGMIIGLPKAANIVDRIEPGSRAQHAGLMKGDVIVEISGERIESGDEMVKIIHGSVNRPLVLVVNREGKRVRIRATPAPGKLGKGVGLLGFTPAQSIRRVGLVESVQVGTRVTTDFIKTIVIVIFSKQIKDNVGGPIAIVAATRASVKGGFDYFVQLMGILSLSLGIMNLLPIPILDGGQMMMLLVEAVRRRRLSPQTWEYAHRVGLTLIAIIFVLIMYLDLSRMLAGKLFQ